MNSINNDKCLVDDESIGSATPTASTTLRMVPRRTAERQLRMMMLHQDLNTTGSREGSTDSMNISDLLRSRRNQRMYNRINHNTMTTHESSRSHNLVDILDAALQVMDSSASVEDDDDSSEQRRRRFMDNGDDNCHHKNSNNDRLEQQ